LGRTGSTPANRTEAIRWLIKAALDAKLVPKGE
jgi:hypothetical protein